MIPCQNKEKIATSKSIIFVKKYERIWGTFMAFAFFSINFVFGTVLEFFFNSQKRTIIKRCTLKKEKEKNVWCNWTKPKIINISDSLCFMVFGLDLSIKKDLVPCLFRPKH